MIQKIKKPISILLSLLMVLSVFVVVPVTASAAATYTKDSAGIDDGITLVNPGDTIYTSDTSGSLLFYSDITCDYSNDGTNLGVIPCGNLWSDVDSFSINDNYMYICSSYGEPSTFIPDDGKVLKVSYRSDIDLWIIAAVDPSAIPQTPVFYTKDSEGIADGIILDSATDMICTVNTSRILVFDCDVQCDYNNEGTSVFDIRKGDTWYDTSSFLINDNNDFLFINSGTSSKLTSGSGTPFKVSYDSSENKWHIIDGSEPVPLPDDLFVKVTSEDQVTEDNIGACTFSDAKEWVYDHWDEITNGVDDGYIDFNFVYVDSNDALGFKNNFGFYLNDISTKEMFKANCNSSYVTEIDSIKESYSSDILYLCKVRDPEPATYTVTWKNGDTVLETDTDVAEGTTPTYDGETPTKAEDENYTYTFAGWSDGTTTYGLSDTLPNVTADVTYTATFDATPKPAPTSGSFDGLTWNIDEEGTLTFSGSGSIPMEAFEKNGDVKKVIINDSVTELGAYAFLGCPNLTEVDIQNPSVSLKGAQHFATAGVTTVTLPEGMTTIPYGMFRGCGALTTVDLPSTITRIEDLAFMDSGLQSISVPEGATYDSNSFRTNSLQSLTLEGSSPMTFTGGELTFLSNAATVYIPEGSTYVYSTTTLYVKDPSNWDAQEMLEDAQEDFNERIEVGISPEEALADVNDLYGDYYGITGPFTVTLNEGDKCEAVFGGATIGKYVPPAPTYTVTWKNEDGTVIDTTEVEEGTVPTHADATKANDTFYSYTFAGWNDGENTYAPSELPAVTGDDTYTATFTAVPFSEVTVTTKADFETAIANNYVDTIIIGADIASGYAGSGNIVSYRKNVDRTLTIKCVGSEKYSLKGYAFRVGSNTSKAASLSFENVIIDGNCPNAISANGYDFFMTVVGANSSLNFKDGAVVCNFYHKSTQSVIEAGRGSNASGNNIQANGLKGTINVYDGAEFYNLGAQFGIFRLNGNAVINMYGGTVRNCTTYDKEAIVAYIANGAAFNMSGGEIKNCTGTSSGNNSVVYLGMWGTSTFTMTGGTITSNTAKHSVFLGTNGSGKITIGGDAKISGGSGSSNIYLANGKTITMHDTHLTEEADIWLYTATNPSNTADVKIATNAVKDDIAYIHSDNTVNAGVVYCDGETDWVYLNGVMTKLNNGAAHHTHTANTIWLSTAANDSNIELNTTQAVTWNNWDGTTIKTDRVAEGNTPSYDGETPTKDEDDDFTYEFIGWMCGPNFYYPDELPIVDGDTTYVATFSSTPKHEAGYYVVGTMTEWKIDDAYLLTANTEAEGDEFMLNNVALTDTDAIKVVKYEPGNWTWYPDGMDNNYEITADGTYDIYFRPNSDGGDDWFEGCIYVVVPPHVHDFIYCDYGDTIEAICTASGCDLTDDNEVTLTIVAPTLTIVGQTGDGISEYATLTGLEAFNEATGLNIAETDIKYYAVETVEIDGNTYKRQGDELDGAPTDAGEYIAGLTLSDVKISETATRDVTARTWYTITEPAPTYTVTWMNGDEVLETDENVEPGALPSYDGDTPTKDEDDDFTYDFIGWTCGPNFYTPDELPIVDGDTTYVATFESTPKHEAGYYVVGTMTEWKIDDAYLLTANTEAEGDEFMLNNVAFTDTDAIKVVKYEAGQDWTWYPSGTGNDYAITADGTYDIYFRPNADGGDDWYEHVILAVNVTEYTITWKNDDGSVIDTTTVAYGEVPTHADPTKDATDQYTYTFTGWTPEVVAATADAEYTATFSSTVNEYTITWKNDDGSVIDTTTVAYGEVPTHADATKDATAQYTYTFTGWTPEVVAVTGDAEYTATFSSAVNEYTITWKNDDGSVIDTTTVAYGEVPTHADATKDATAQYTYTFTGWDTEPVAVTGDAEYTATFSSTVNEYTITWKNDDGTVIDTTTVAYGDTPTHADATKEATEQYTYTFTGWTPEVVAVTGDAEYTATFDEVKKPLLGDADGDGEVTVIDATMIQRVLASMPGAVVDKAAADVDGDGEVTVVDATYIQRYLASMPVAFPINEYVD